MNESKKEIQQLGFEDIVIANMHNTVDVSNLGDFNVIYVCGGNTFAILQKLRETGLSAFIIQQVQAGAVYVGVSAGSIIAGPSIEMASWGSEGDENEIGLKDLSGLSLVDIEVFPHFHEELRSEVEEFKKKVSYRVYELTNGQAVFSNNSDQSPARVVLLNDMNEPILVVTTNDVPGYEVVKVYGEVFGVLVRSRNLLSNIGAGFKSLVGGEIGAYTKLLSDSRIEATERMKAAAAEKGANAILMMRFDTGNISGSMNEVAAYGTAVTIRPIK